VSPAEPPSTRDLAGTVGYNRFNDLMEPATATLDPTTRTPLDTDTTRIVGGHTPWLDRLPIPHEDLRWDIRPGCA
jgi:hypothetical protein